MPVQENVNGDSATATSTPPETLIGLSFDQSNQKTVDGDTVKLCGVIPFILPQGIYPIPKNSAEKLDALTLELTKEYAGTHVTPEKMKENILLAIHLNPTDDISSARMRAFISFLILLRSTLSAAQVKGGAKYSDAIRPAMDFINNFFHDGYTATASAHAQKFVQLCASAQFGSSFGENSAPFRQDWLNTLTSHCLHNLQISTPGDAFSDLTTDMFQSHISGLNPALEFIALVKDLVISEEIRADILFQRMKVAFGSAAYAMNQILGLSRLNQGSEILTKAKLTSTPLQIAFDEAKEHVMSQINDVKLSAQKVRECYWDDEDLTEYVNCLERALDGQLYFLYDQAKRNKNGCFEIVNI